MNSGNLCTVRLGNTCSVSLPRLISQLAVPASIRKPYIAVIEIQFDQISGQEEISQHGFVSNNNINLYRTLSHVQRIDFDLFHYMFFPSFKLASRTL